MGKTKKLDELEGLNEMKKQEMTNILGGEMKETESKKKRFLTFCGGLLRQ